MRYSLLAGVGAAALGFASPAMAGNVVLTGHDDDFHCSQASDSHTSPGIGPCEQLGAMAAFATQSSTPAGTNILVIDQNIGRGLELSSSLTALGYTVTTKPATGAGAVTAADFNHATYSAFAVASVTSCGGCDNPIGTGTALKAFATSIATFFDAGGGIVGLTSATDNPGGFSYVPDAASGTPITSVSGFTATANGKSDIPGFDTVNGDETHNIFTSFAGYSVAETSSADGGKPVTIYIKNGTISCTAAGTCTIHGAPEPMTLSLLGAGLFGLGAARRFRRR